MTGVGSNVPNAKSNNPFNGRTRHYGMTPPVIKQRDSKPTSTDGTSVNNAPEQPPVSNAQAQLPVNTNQASTSSAKTKEEKQIGNLISFVQNFSNSVEINNDGNVDVKVEALNIVQGKVTEPRQNQKYQDNLKILGLTWQTDKTITSENSHLHYFALGSALKNETINPADADKIKSFKTGIPPEDFINLNEKLFGLDFMNNMIEGTNLPEADKKQLKNVIEEYQKISNQYEKIPKDERDKLESQLIGNDESKNKYTPETWASLHNALKKKEIVEQHNLNKARDTLSPEQKKKFDKLSPDAQRDKVKQMLKTDNLADPTIADKLNDTSVQDNLRKGYDTIGDAQQKSEQERRDMESGQFKQQIKNMTDHFTNQVESITAMNQGMGKMLQGLMGLSDMLSKMRQSIFDRTNQRMAQRTQPKEQQERSKKHNGGWGATGG